jgi:sarcosine reductase
MGNMHLKIEIIQIRDARFGAETLIKDGVLFINKQELIEHLADPLLEKIDVDIARPGESVRIVPVKDVLEPRIKASEDDGSFPGYLGKFDGCGDGVTKVLRGCAVVTAGRIMAFQEGLIDMSGIGTEYCYYSKLNNIVVIADPVEGVTPPKHEELLRLAGLKAAHYIAKAAKEVSSHETEDYELKPVSADLPKIAYVYCVMAQGLLHDNYLYGVDCKKIHPTLLHPNEIMDSALVSGNCVTASDKNTTYDHQNNPVIAELYSRHGVDLNFVGVILSPICPGLADKERCATGSINIARQIGADAVIIAEEGGGNPEADLMMLCRNAEKKGIKTVLMMQENAGPDGTAEPITDTTPEADAVISVGNCNHLVTLPKMDKTIGYEEAVRHLSGNAYDCINPDGSINASLSVIMASVNSLGMSKLSSVIK